MRFRRIVVMILSIMALALVSVGSVSAAPTNAKNAETFELPCDNGETYTIVVNGNGTYTPGHIISGDGGNLIPVAFTFMATDEQGNVLFTDEIAKNGQMNGLTDDLFTCSFGGTFEEEGQVIIFSGTVTAFLTPRG